MNVTPDVHIEYTNGARVFVYLQANLVLLTNPFNVTPTVVQYDDSDGYAITEWTLGILARLDITDGHVYNANADLIQQCVYCNKWLDIHHIDSYLAQVGGYCCESCSIKHQPKIVLVATGYDWSCPACLTVNHLDSIAEGFFGMKVTCAHCDTEYARDQRS